MAEWAFVALGSNVGERETHLAAARQFLAAAPQTSLVAESEIDETEPVGPVTQGPYLNQMVLLKTDLTPRELLGVCHDAEDQAGRVRRERWGPRTLDLDIVRFDDLQIREQDLVVPHPELRNRGFWLRELAELLPQATDGEQRPALPVWAQVGKKRRKHITRVAGLVEAWAIAMGVTDHERLRWIRAAYMHDAVKEASPHNLAAWADERWGVPSLYHGPAAAHCAEKHGETDVGVLDAIRYHSVGYAGWDDVGRMLYLADYLEPGRSGRRPERAALVARVPNEPDDVLQIVVRQRLILALNHNLRTLPESIEFWNAIVQSR